MANFRADAPTLAKSSPARAALKRRASRQATVFRPPATLSSKSRPNFGPPATRWRSCGCYFARFSRFGAKLGEKRPNFRPRCLTKNTISQPWDGLCFLEAALAPFNLYGLRRNRQIFDSELNAGSTEDPAGQRSRSGGIHDIQAELRRNEHILGGWGMFQASPSKDSGFCGSFGVLAGDRARPGGRAVSRGRETLSSAKCGRSSSN